MWGPTSFVTMTTLRLSLSTIVLTSLDNRMHRSWLARLHRRISDCWTLTRRLLGSTITSPTLGEILTVSSCSVRVQALHPPISIRLRTLTTQRSKVRIYFLRYLATSNGFLRHYHSVWDVRFLCFHHEYTPIEWHHGLLTALWGRPRIQPPSIQPLGTPLQLLLVVEVVCVLFAFSLWIWYE